MKRGLFAVACTLTLAACGNEPAPKVPLLEPFGDCTQSATTASERTVCAAYKKVLEEDKSRPFSVIYPSAETIALLAQQFDLTTAAPALARANILRVGKLEEGTFKSLDGKSHAVTCTAQTCLIDQTVTVALRPGNNFSDGSFYRGVKSSDFLQP